MADNYVIDTISDKNKQDYLNISQFIVVNTIMAYSLLPKLL